MFSTSRPGRDLRTHRSVQIEPGFHRLAEGSVLYRAEGTVLLVTASVDDQVPKFLQGTGRGWLTAEYQMHPRANPKRREKRDGRGEAVSGRAKEIERLIGRALRASVDFERLGERTISLDCDVLEADGGTRTAAITAGWVALALAANRLFASGVCPGPLLRDQVASISVGHVAGELALDLCYAEDSKARVDMNVVGTARGAVIEVQSTAEGSAVARSEIDAMIDLGFVGIESLCRVQRGALKAAAVPLSRVLRGAEDGA